MSLSKYPAQLDDSSSVPLAVDLVTPVEALVFNRLRAAVFNVQAELGTNPSREFGTVRARLDDLRDLIETLSTLLDNELNKVKVSSVDTTSGYLNTKLVAGNNITITKLNSGSDEKLRITAAVIGSNNLATVAPVNVDANIAAIGVSAEAAKADHKHDITTAVAVSIGAANSAGMIGTATLAASDHTHAVTDLNMVGQQQGSVLYFDGFNWLQLPPGEDGYVLTTHDILSDPTWESNGGWPTSADKDLTPAICIGNFRQTALFISGTPFNNSYVRVDINSLSVVLGDGVKTKDCYFSDDAGVNAKSIANIVAGDQLIWNSIIAGFNLDANDRINLYYVTE